MAKLKFSIVIPVKELNKYLEESVPKILELDYENFDIVILPNESPQSLPAYAKNKKVRIIPTGKVSPAIKRDIGVKKSNCKYAAFIDDDAYPKRDWLRVAEKVFSEKKVAAIGGPAITPRDDSDLRKASGLFFETLLGGGGMDYRYKPARESFYVEDFPSVNLIVSRDAFLEAGGFGSEYWPGEDTKFCLNLVKLGHRIWYSNKLVVYHHRRKLFSQHLKQIAGYGLHRGFFAKRFPETSFKLVYLMPSLFLIGNIELFFLSFYSYFFLKLWLALLGVYFVLATVDSAMRTQRIKIIALTVIAIFLSHLVYGAMFIKGLFTWELKSKLR